MFWHMSVCVSVHPPPPNRLCSGRYASCVHAGGLSCYRPHPKDGGRYCFQFVCQSTSRGVPQSGLGGYPIPGLAGGVPHPRSGQRGTPSQVWWGGTPSQVCWGVPHPRSGRGVPGVPPQTRSGWGSIQTWDGVPPSTWDGVHPPDLGRGTPQTWDVVSPLPPGIASTCYVAGGMPLAFNLMFKRDLIVTDRQRNISSKCGALFKLIQG